MGDATSISEARAILCKTHVTSRACDLCACLSGWERSDTLNNIVLTCKHVEYLENALTEVGGEEGVMIGLQVLQRRTWPTGHTTGISKTCMMHVQYTYLK